MFSGEAVSARRRSTRRGVSRPDGIPDRRGGPAPLGRASIKDRTTSAPDSRWVCRRRARPMTAGAGGEQSWAVNALERDDHEPEAVAAELTASYHGPWRA